MACLKSTLRRSCKKRTAETNKKAVLPKYDKIYRLLGSPELQTDSKSPYKWLLHVTDHIASMTDSRAIQEFRRLKGIALN
jgi:dGTP triphosphohydrolase